MDLSVITILILTAICAPGIYFRYRREEAKRKESLNKSQDQPEYGELLYNPAMTPKDFAEWNKGKHAVISTRSGVELQGTVVGYSKKHVTIGFNSIKKRVWAEGEIDSVDVIIHPNKFNSFYHVSITNIKNNNELEVIE